MKSAKLTMAVVALWAGVTVAALGAGEPQQYSREAGRRDRFVTGELLVGYRAGVGPTGQHALYRREGADFVEDVGHQNSRVVKIRVPAGAEEAMARRLAARPEVKFVERNYEFTPALTPNDPQYASQWHLPIINAGSAWDLSKGNGSAVIAILDSGIDAAQPDFAGKLVAGYNTFSNTTVTSDDYGHGTEVAGVAGALLNNGVGVAGVAGGSPLMPVRVTNSSGAATASSIANGIVWATDHGARVINLSFDGVAGNTTIRTAAEYAFNHGTLVVAAAGNCSCANATLETPFILSVSATDESDALAYFSSTGPYVDVSAPGTNILTTARFGLYVADSGTSLASPVVAGLAGLMFSAKPSLTPALATQMLEGTAVDLGNAGYDSSFGYGRVNALAAVTAAVSYTPPLDTKPPVVAIAAPGSGSTVSGAVVVDVAASDDVGVVKVDLYVDGIYFASDTVSPYSFAWDSSAMSNGAHTLRAVAADAAGNSARTTDLPVTVTNQPPDVTPPVVSITAPVAGSTVSGSTVVAVSATDNVGVVSIKLYIDGTLVGTVATATYTYTWITTPLANGAHTLDAVATDAAGNATHALRSVTVSNNVKHAPVAGNDTFVAPYRSAATYAAQVFAILANDSDADGDLSPATVQITSSPNSGGTVKVNANGTVAYTPKQKYTGTETFRYTVKDLRGAVSNTATVTVSVGLTTASAGAR